ncbi:hypothetical protein AMECASPLE_035686 [Ameca splendens]|uniref:Uncharacterized protein n=1 Tax=Ameca splendens TaxID=208324 RepID=A0ABV0YUH4_9TELE
MEARRQRINMEKARRHHNSKLLSTALNAWSKYHCQHQRNKVMKRQGLLLLRLKMYQKFFEQWKTKLQHRQRLANQTERALWHWSLTLQAKVTPASTFLSYIKTSCSIPFEIGILFYNLTMLSTSQQLSP